MISLGFVVEGEIRNNTSHLCSGLFHFERLVLDRWRLSHSKSERAALPGAHERTLGSALSQAP